VAQTTSNKLQTSNITNPILNYIYLTLTIKQKTCSKMTNLAKMLVLNWHNQNLNIITVEMLKVLLHWLCSKAWESEFIHPWQQWICHHVCSLV